VTFLAPGFFFASLAVAAGVVALHFIVTRQPRAGILPTARFVPNLPATATAKHTRPSDLLLMLLRVLLVVAAGTGLARPVFRPSRGAEARVILADVSRSTRDTVALRDSVKALRRSHDALIVFDSAARIVGASDSASSLHPSTAKGNLAAAMIAAQRAASTLRDHADSIELVIVSPFAAEEFDNATADVRRLWPGRARLVKISAPVDTSIARSLDVKASADDPFQVASGIARRFPDVTAVIVRNGSASQSSADRAVVDWPASARPRGAIQRARPDLIGGVGSGKSLVVAPFERRWVFPADSIRGATIIARWIDGEPAAVEWNQGPACIRSVAIPVASTGDLVLRDDFARLVAAVAAECGSLAALKPADPRLVEALRGPASLAPRAAFLPRGDVRSAIAPWLIALAIALAMAELFVRRRRNEAPMMRRSQTMERAA
jgi:hypothetical protein